MGAYISSLWPRHESRGFCLSMVSIIFQCPQKETTELGDQGSFLRTLHCHLTTPGYCVPVTGSRTRPLCLLVAYPPSVRDQMQVPEHNMLAAIRSRCLKCTSKHIACPLILVEGPARNSVKQKVTRRVSHPPEVWRSLGKVPGVSLATVSGISFYLMSFYRTKGGEWQGQHTACLVSSTRTCRLTITLLLLPSLPLL